MRIGFYQHGSVMDAGVAAVISAMGLKVQPRNALYFNERETEKFDRVVVDDGKNTAAITDAYGEAGVEVVTLNAFLDEGQAPAATPLPSTPKLPTASTFNPDAPRTGKKPPRAQGEAKAQ